MNDIVNTYLLVQRFAYKEQLQGHMANHAQALIVQCISKKYIQNTKKSLIYKEISVFGYCHE
jgi:hypothetical protein